ncbi:MAG: hypothetical protein QOC80_986, partial [Frankiaceae bacterium]|nr:hypothetical protein [Frankiaceae bacterium]
EAPVRELRALGLTDDGKSLVLVDLSRGAEGERFRVSADERLRAALRSGAPRAVAAQAETRVESALSPREIQARLRAGASADEVAKAAGIPVGRIQRYEAPILAERDRVVSEARRASAPGPHRNTPGRPLGTLVDNRLVEEEADPESVEWDARRRPDGTWLVTLAMHAGSSVRATWSWDPQARRVRAIDAGATAMLAPMPAPSTGPDSLTAVAEAAGVSTETTRQPEQQAVAVGETRSSGDDVRRRSGRTNGLVVLSGRGNEPQPERATATLPDDAEIDLDVPGGAYSPATRREPITPRVDASDLLLPGAAPLGDRTTVRRAEPEVRPSRQERLPQASATDSVITERPTARTAAPLAPTAPTTAPAEPRPTEAPATGSIPEPAVAEADTQKTSGTATSSPNGGARPTKSPAGRRRSAVPAWDDIMFGARRS